MATRKIVFLLGCLASGVARGGEPVASTDSQGYVTGNVHVGVPLESVRSYLSEPARAVTLSPDAALVSTTRKGPCSEITVRTRGMSEPFEYVSLRCATADGFSEHLVSSDNFYVNTVQWRLVEEAGGTDVTLRIKTRVNWIPAALIDLHVSRAVSASLSRLKAKLSPG